MEHGALRECREADPWEVIDERNPHGTSGRYVREKRDSYRN